MKKIKTIFLTIVIIIQLFYVIFFKLKKKEYNYLQYYNS